jgi:hypothetical protein
VFVRVGFAVADIDLLELGRPVLDDTVWLGVLGDEIVLVDLPVGVVGLAGDPLRLEPLGGGDHLGGVFQGNAPHSEGVAGAFGVVSGDGGFDPPCRSGDVGLFELSDLLGQLSDLLAGLFGGRAELGCVGRVSGGVGAGGPDGGVLGAPAELFGGGGEFVSDVTGRPVLLPGIGGNAGA